MATNGFRKKKSRIKGLEVKAPPEGLDSPDFSIRSSLIQQIVPLALKAVFDEMQREIAELLSNAPPEAKMKRFGSNPGTVFLTGQKIPIRVPRVRSKDGEVPLKSYAVFHKDDPFDEKIHQALLGGLTCSNLENILEIREGSIGTSKSTISKKFIRVSQKKLDEFQKRNLQSLDIIAIFIDGKYFSEDQMVIAVGITLDGTKIVLGFIQTDTENKTSISDFLRELLQRGLKIEGGLLVVIDGSKGLHAAIRAVFGKYALIQRCQWHKRENVVSYLTKGRQKEFRGKLQKAYERPTHQEAKDALLKIHLELEDVNQSAAQSLKEGFEETLTLHSLGIFQVLGKSLKTTNCIESINASIEAKCKRIDYWKNSSQKQRWLASALIEIELTLRRLRGSSHLPALRYALQQKLLIDPNRQIQ